MTRPMFRNVELYNYGNLSLAIYFLNKNRLWNSDYVNFMKGMRLINCDITPS